MNCFKLHCYYCKQQVKDGEEWCFYNLHILHKGCQIKYKYK